MSGIAERANIRSLDATIPLARGARTADFNDGRQRSVTAMARIGESSMHHFKAAPSTYVICKTGA